MLEVRYNKATNKVTGWCNDIKQFGLLKDLGNEEIIILDIPFPPKPREAYLFDGVTSTLMVSPEFIEPEPPRDLAYEIDVLKVRLTALEPKAL